MNTVQLQLNACVCVCITAGVHTVQMMYGCERDDNGTTRTYLQYGYDGEDLISLDLKTGNWTAADEVESYIVRWIPTIHEAKYWMDFLENECIEWLKKFLLYGSEALKRKGNSILICTNENVIDF